MATEALMPMQPSLASATNTRVDSSKLHFQCRVSTDDMISMTETGKDQDDLLRNKYRYCIHKDELVVAVGRPWSAGAARKKTNNAYPRVISNMGAMDGNSERGKLFQKVIKYMYNFARTVQEKQCILNALNNHDRFNDPGNYRRFPDGADVTIDEAEPYFTRDDVEKIKAMVMPYMYDQIPMGYATTLGWAHPNTGDTMVTVMIGGIRTVMNGDFEVFTGDLIQWYWPFERDCFQKNGQRKPYLNGWRNFDAGDRILQFLAPNFDPAHEADGNNTGALAPDAKRRKTYHTQVYGQKLNAPKVVPYIKPYMRDDRDPRMYDGLRVFAVAVTSARPHEMVDIKIARQTC